MLEDFMFKLQDYYLLWWDFPDLFVYNLSSLMHVHNPNKENFVGLG
jgi:hypothetical protein